MIVSFLRDLLRDQGGVTTADLGLSSPVSRAFYKPMRANGTANINNINMYSQGEVGGPCVKDNKPGTLKMVSGQLQCVVKESNKESKMNPTSYQPARTLSETAIALRFSSPSRDQLAKQYRIWDVHRRIIQGLNGMIIHPIAGTPGNWYFDLESNVYNRAMETDRFNRMMIAGVTVKRTDGGGPYGPQMDIPTSEIESKKNQPKSLSEKSISESLRELVTKRITKSSMKEAASEDQIKKTYRNVTTSGVSHEDALRHTALELGMDPDEVRSVINLRWGRVAGGRGEK